MGTPPLSNRGGWVRCEKAWIAEELATGDPLCRTLARLHLRLLADEEAHTGTPMPSISSLASQWNRSRKFVRARMAETWEDPTVSSGDTPGTGEGQQETAQNQGNEAPRDSGGTAEGQAPFKEGCASEPSTLDPVVLTSPSQTARSISAEEWNLVAGCAGKGKDIRNPGLLRRYAEVIFAHMDSDGWQGSLGPLLYALQDELPNKQRLYHDGWVDGCAQAWCAWNEVVYC